jgi:predicted nucleotidyltransferase
MEASVTNVEQLLRVLADAGVEFVVIGGVAAAMHGSARATYDLDIVYHRTAENVARVSKALLPYEPYLRGAPRGLPFRWDPQTILAGLNFTLTTTLGSIDLLGEVTGGGTYQQLLPHSLRLEVFGVPCLCLDLEMLIHVKRAAGRPKDLQAIAELEVLRQEAAKQRRYGAGRE